MSDFTMPPREALYSLGMQKRLSFMVSDELFERVELARGDVARERWLRRAVERALGESRVIPSPEDVGVSPAPAEQPEGPYVFEQERQAVRAAVESGAKSVRVEAGSALAGRDRAGYPAPQVREFRPYPKGGKR